jgi:hypothetical protein
VDTRTFTRPKKRISPPEVNGQSEVYDVEFCREVNSPTIVETNPSCSDEENTVPNVTVVQKQNVKIPCNNNNLFYCLTNCILID